MYTGRKLMIEILVAEDDEMIANLIKINLVKAGYLCTCAYNGKDAANLLDSKHFDLCLFDIMLPEIDGYGVCKVNGHSVYFYYCNGNYR